MPSQRFSCNECPKSYPNSHGLKRHSKIHTGELHYCSLCKKGFPNETEQRRHRKICILSAKTLTFGCKTCGNAFGRQSDLNAHTKSCSRKYNSKQSNPTNVEKKQSIDPEIIQCQFCDKPFTNFEEWKEHEDAESEGLNAKNNINSVFAGLKGDFYDDTPLVIDISSKNDEPVSKTEYLSQKEPLSTDAELDDNDPFVMDVDTDSNEKAKTSSKTNTVKEHPVFEAQIISAVKALDASNNVDTLKTEENSKPVHDWNGLSKWIAEKNEASFMTLQEENEPKTSTANLPDSIRDKLKEVQDIANKMDTSLEHSDMEEDAVSTQAEKNSTRQLKENSPKESGYPEVNAHVNDAFIESDKKDKIDYQCKECNKKCESIDILKNHNYSHKRGFFCEICLKGFSEINKLSRHKEGRDHQFQLSNSLKTVRNHKSEPNNSLKTPPVSENSVQDVTYYQCKECFESFKSISMLKDHNFIHKRGYFCEICLKGFKDMKSLSRHEEGRDHKFQKSNNLKIGKDYNFEEKNNLKTSPVSENKSKSKFSKDQLLVLTQYFDEYKHLQKQHEKEICQKTNLPLKSINMWFINRRKYYRENSTETKISSIVTENVFDHEDKVSHQSSNDRVDMKTWSQFTPTAQFDTKSRNETFQTASQIKSTEQLLKEFTNVNKTHFCETCQQDFFDKSNLNKHMNTQSHKTKLRKNTGVDDTQKNNPKQESFVSQDMQQWSFQSKANTDIQNSSMSYQNVSSHHEQSYQQYMSIKETPETTVNKSDANIAQNDTAKDDIIESPPSPGPEIITEIPRYNNQISSYSSEPHNDVNMLQEKARRYDTMQALRPMFGVMMQQMSAFYQTLFQTTSGLPSIQQNDQFGRPIQHQNSFNNGFNGYPGTYAPITYDANSGYPTSSTPGTYDVSSGYPRTSWDNTTTQFNNGYSPSPMPTTIPPNNSYAPSYSNYGQQYGDYPQANSRVVYSTVVPDKPVYSDPRKPTVNNSTTNNDVEVINNPGPATQCDSTTNIEVAGSNSVSTSKVGSQSVQPQTPAQPMKPQSFESRNPSAFSSSLAANTPAGGSDVPMDLSAK